MIRFRHFRNDDPPALTKLWNRAIPGIAAARPLRVQELDTHAFGMVHFDPRGLIVAEREREIFGFVHAGFGPLGAPEDSPPLQLNTGMGTIAMLIVSPELEDLSVDRGLTVRAEAYLRDRGARVIYLGGQFPLNPFYWGLYGGSEFAGILSGHDRWNRLALDLGYEPVSSTVILENDLDQSCAKDPRAPILRRQTRLSLLDEELPRNWWESLALGNFHLTRFRLTSKLDEAEIARACTWDMSWFGRVDCRARIAVIDFEVAPECRRKGYGRFLMTEVLRSSREQMFQVAQVQTSATNQAALALYESAGFRPVDEATLYRLPSHLMDRRV